MSFEYFMGVVELIKYVQYSLLFKPPQSENLS